MIEVIRRHAELAAAWTGRATLSESVLTAMSRIPRHLFVPRMHRAVAYFDRACPIGHGQTISQPFVVALMADLLDLAPADRLLEIGAGCGYFAAVASELAGEVFAVERVAALEREASQRLAQLGHRNVRTLRKDGANGWPENAPYDAIALSCASESIPAELFAQLGAGGRLVAPIGRAPGQQLLTEFRKDADGAIHERAVLPVSFVPLVRDPAE